MSIEQARANGSESGISTAVFNSRSLLTIKDVAKLLKVPVSWVYERTRRRAADRIPGFRLGKYWRFREADIVAWLEKQREGASPNA